MTSKQTRAVALPTTVQAVVPDLSPELRAEMERFMEGGHHPGHFRATTALIAEAQAALPALERVCAQPTPAQIDSWLLKLQAAVNNPPNEKDHTLRLEAVYFALGDLPAGCWSFEALREAMRHFKFWPTIAELDAFLRPKAERLWRLRTNLTAMALAEPFRPNRPRPSAEEDARQAQYDRIAEETRSTADALGVSIVEVVRGLGKTLAAPRAPHQSNVISFDAAVGEGTSAAETAARFPALSESIKRGRARLMEDPSGVGREAQKSVAAALRKPSSGDAA